MKKNYLVYYDMKKFSFFSLAFIMIGLCMCVSCGYLFSTVLVSSGLFSNSSQITSLSQTLYSISIASDEKESVIQNLKTDLQSQNGAGFVYKNEDKFFLLSSIYENKADAELVKSNLSSNGITSEIIQIEISSNIVDGNFSADEKSILSECLKSNFEIYKKLYDITISLDTGIYDTTKAKLECNSLYSTHVATKTNFDTIFKDKKLNFIGENLKKTESELSNLISENYETSSQTYSSLIKLTYCKILLN